MTDWGTLRGPFGPATEVPELLRRGELTSDFDDEAWGELWDALIHQGTVYSASYAALPALCAMAVARPDVALEPAYFLATSIIASSDLHDVAPIARTKYAAEIASLRPIAERKLALFADHSGFLYALEALAAVEDVDPWQEDVLGQLADGLVRVDCPRCDQPTELEVAHPQVDLVELRCSGALARPAIPDRLGPAERRLWEKAVEHHQTSVGQELLWLFGEMDCPGCGTRFPIKEGLY